MLLGLLGVVFICGLTPYNDYVVKNTYVVGNYLPIGLLLFFISFVMVINAPLWRWAPRAAFSSGELAVAMGMVLCSCAIPSSGLMRNLPAVLSQQFHYASDNNEYAGIIDQVNLPSWILPRLERETAKERGQEWLVRYYRGRIPAGQVETETLWSQMWSAWARPIFTWGILVAAVWGGVICGAVILRRQWVENERLAFPLATVYLSLIEAPEPGRGLNALFRMRSFWIAAGAVFCVHFFYGMNQYDSVHWPAIPIKYDLGSVFSDAPWSHLSWFVKQAGIFFSMIGFAYFLQGQVAFSLWFFMVLLQVTLMSYGTYQAQFTEGAQRDQLFGGLFPFALTILWVGRHHWGMVAKQMIGRRQANDPSSRYLPYGIAGWGLVACLLVAATWIVAAGATVVGAVVIVGMMFLFFLCIARIVAETGLIFAQIPMDITRPLIFGLTEVPGMVLRTTTKSFYLTAKLDTIFLDLRESLAVYSTNALRVTDETYQQERTRGIGAGFIGAIALALLVGYFVAWGSMLTCEYAYGTTLDTTGETPINKYAVEQPKEILEATRGYIPPGTGPKETHSRIGHFTFGAVLTGFLSMMRLRFAAWPLHPIGFLVVYSWPLANMWFSIFIGWLAKALMVKFGGTTLYRAARPAFTGLIIGEAAAAAFWLVVSLVLNSMDIQYKAINLLPV